MHHKIFLSLLGMVLFLFSQGFAQENTIHGLVVVDFEDEHPKGVIVTNLQTQVSVKTDITGSFKMHATVGDTLYLRSGFLESRKLAVRAIHFEYDPLVVHMNQEVIKLADIVVRPALTGDLEKDMASVEKHEQIEQVYANLGIDIRTLDIDPQEKQEKVLPYWGMPTVINIGALVKSINGDYRKMENLRQYEALDSKFQYIINHFGEKYFEDIIGIQSSDAREFLLYLYGQEKALFNISFIQKDFLTLDQSMRKYAVKFKHRLSQKNDSIQMNSR